jgi:16S rRNA (guanine527-N7)-methyltransferase
VLSILKRNAEQYGVRLTDAQLAQFDRYLALLAEWNERANLVGDASPEVVVRRHFLESIAIGAALRQREALRPRSDVLDVGSGAGFPGAVMKLVWPSVRLTLLDATARKTAFLSALVAELGLDGVEVLTGRAEDLAHDPALRGRFDLVLARAVAPLPALLELTLPFARRGGRVVSPKGSRAAEEVAAAGHAAEVLGARLLSVPFEVPGEPQTLVVAVKTAHTPDAYPRRPGMPEKRPL